MESSKVLDFSAFRKKQIKKEINHSPKTDYEIFQDLSEEVLFEWESKADKNRLNEYFLSFAPIVEYDIRDMNDRNYLASIEQKLQMKTAILSPGTTLANEHGWLVSFHANNKVFSTPPEMATEASARAMCIILFLKFKHRMKTHNLALDI